MFTLLFISSASANLIVNGGFEENSPTVALGGGGGWKYYAAGDLNGWDGSNIELWGTHGIKSYEGGYHAELNAHGQRGGVWSISQTFGTIAGQTYNLFFAYSARLSNSAGSIESFSVNVDNFYTQIDDHTVGSWSTFLGSFVADDNFATLTFSSISQHRWTYGNFLDDIRVSGNPSVQSFSTVSEPGLMGLFALGLLGLIVKRRKSTL